MISGISWILKFRITQRSNVSVMTGYQCLNRLCVRKFSRVFLFPSFVSNNRFLWTRQFSFAHFTRQRLFVIFSYEISPELIPSRMPDVQPLFLFAWGSWQSHVEIKSTSLGQKYYIVLVPTAVCEFFYSPYQLPKFKFEIGLLCNAARYVLFINTLLGGMVSVNG